MIQIYLKKTLFGMLDYYIKMKDAQASVYRAVSNREWIRGKFLDSGGMSKLYHATCKQLPGNYVIKIGKLTTEVGVYTNICKPYTLKAKGIKCMPEYIDGGIHKDTQEQFLVLKKYNQSYPLTEIISDNAFINITRDTLCAMKYLHENNYIHNDIKPENILYNGENFILCDFGVSTKWNPEGNPEYDTNRFCGTKIFTGLDMHTKGQGPSPRSDMESLVFSMLRWCAIKLPWGKIKSLKDIYTLKYDFLESPDTLLSICPSKIKQDIIKEFITHAGQVLFNKLPDYTMLNKILDTAETYISAPCCELREHLQLVRNKLMLSDDPKDISAIAALKYVDIWNK
uniref:non-specific serine/threonine protein kinase n=1 Tax=Rhinella marina erythrocytic-like virus TaxID=2859906 RepID=A0A8F6UB04_9VIRU|nr:serine-threonine protein kinase [Rhinella marina erythrocytic-like virus]